ncbi:MAG: hypothetical protein J7518_00260 [Nocardioidaceae bacterium]|nr:hypothetical protein [Nocardioidaceae bacterium]
MKIIRILAALGLAVPVIALAVALPIAGPASAEGEKLPQTLHFTSDVPTGIVAFARYGAAVTAESSSGLPVTLSVEPGNPVCSVGPEPPFIHGNVGIGHAGTCTVYADQAGDDQYAPAERIEMSFEVGRVPTGLFAAKASKGALGLTPTTFRAALRYDGWFGPNEATLPFPGQLVTFSVAGKTMCSATTVYVQDDTVFGEFFGSAIATCKAPIGLANALKQSTYTATFAGTPDYLPSTATGVLK